MTRGKKQNAEQVLDPEHGAKSREHDNQAANVAAKKQVPHGGEKKKKATKTPPKEVKKMLTVTAKSKKLLDWAKLLSMPFVGTSEVKCPLNFNPSPSLLSFRTTLVDTNPGGISVSAGYCRQVVLWPGHNALATPPVLVGSTGYATLPDLDEVAYHARFQTIGATTYAIGPCDSKGGPGVTRSGVMHWVSADALINAGQTTDTTASGVVNTWDNPLPFVADPTIAGHLRWKCIAMGIRIRNITPIQTRGGSIVTVQPANVISMQAGAQAALDVNPSFRVWGDGTDEVEISWIPRTRDLSYWHMTAASSASGVDLSSNQITGPAILVFLNAPAGTNQTYVRQVYAHFELSGTYAQVFSNQSHSMALPPQPVQQALGAHINNSPTAYGIHHTIAAGIGEVVTSGLHALKGEVQNVAREGVKAAVSMVKASL